MFFVNFLISFILTGRSISTKRKNDVLLFHKFTASIKKRKGFLYFSKGEVDGRRREG